MQDTFARATHSAGRPSAARDDRVSCIQLRRSSLAREYCLAFGVTELILVKIINGLRSGRVFVKLQSYRTGKILIEDFPKLQGFVWFGSYSLSKT